MATINYKEKYEKAVQAAMLAKQDTESAVTVQTLEEIFPELRGSEDERIRKEIISYLKRRLKIDSSIPAAIGYWIAWLEKQIEQKPAWSEEDETGLTNTIIMLKEGASLHFNKKDITKALDWLKSLKDRVQPQPKQEWSKEDEQMLNDIIKDLVHPWNEYIPDRIEDEIIWLKNRLKSLRPQSQWKPSDEQMDALRYVTNFDYGGHKATLVSLYEQLKKLKA